MTYLTSHLPFPTSDTAKTHPASLPPPRSHLIVSDTLASPGHFALYHLIAASIARKQKVVWVDLRVEGKSSLESVLRKMSVVLPSTSAGFTHISPSALPLSLAQQGMPCLYDDNDAATLRPTFDTLSKAITPDSLVILDGLSDLLAIGFTPAEVFRFVRASHAQISAAQAVLVSTLHVPTLGETSNDENELLERLLRIGTGWWRVDGLSSGRSGDVHGEISSFPLVSAGPGWPSVPRSQPLQYRLEGSTVKVFPKGTGRGFL